MASLVQSKSGTATSGTTVTVTLTSNTTAGNCLVVCAGTSTGTVSGIKLGGSAGNFAKAKGQTESAGGLGTLDCEVWTDQSCAGGQTSVVVTFSGTVSNAYAFVMEWSGISASLAVDKTNSGGANSNAFSSGSTGVLTNPNEVVIGAVIGASIGTTSITGPTAPWTNLAVLSSSTFAFLASYQPVTATTAQTYAGTVTGSSTQFYAAVIVTLTEAAAGPTTSPFTPRNSATGKPAIRRGTSTSVPGAKYVSFPSKFTLPTKPARGAPASVRGKGCGKPGAKYVDFPSAFQAPRKPAKGTSATRRGTSTAGPGAKYIHVVPPGPSPFTLPTGPAKGRPAIQRGRSASVPGAPYFHISTFVLPTRPAKGSQIARRGSWASSAGAPFVTFPSPFVLPKTAAKGRSAIQRGRSESSPGARFVLIRISPFVLPKAPARGRSAIRTGRSSAGSATGQGAPVIPRQLIIALASAAGVDDYGNPFPEGILVTAGLIEGPTVIAGEASQTQVVLTDSATSGAGEVQFQPNDSRFLFGAVNSEIIGSPQYDSLGIIGPASTAAGFGDWVEQAFNSANAAGTSTANWQIFYIDTGGGGHLVAVVDSNGFTVAGNLIVDGAATFNGAVTFNGPVTFNDGCTINGGLTVDTINGSNQTGTGLPGGSPTGGPNGSTFAGHTHDFDGHTHAI